MSALRIPPELLAQITNIVQDEIRGLYHGSLVIFDGGSSLADHGSIKIVDSQGIQFISHLHEIGFKFYDGKI